MTSGSAAAHAEDARLDLTSSVSVYAPMVRIEVSAEAYAAIVDTLGGGAIQDPQRSPSGGYSLIVGFRRLDALTAQRQPGERLSDVILRLVATEAGRRP